MSKKSGAQNRRDKIGAFADEHTRIVAESIELFRDYFLHYWGKDGARYAAAVKQFREQAPSDIPNDMYSKQRLAMPSILSDADLAVALLAVKGFGQSSGGLSHKRLGKAFKICGVGWSMAKASPCFETLVVLGLIEKTGEYSKGNFGTKYKLTEKATAALLG